MAQHFIYSLECPLFRTFWEDSYSQMMNDVAGENDPQTLTIPHLKVCHNAEHNVFENAAKNSNWTLRRGLPESFLSVCAWWSYLIEQG